MTDAEFRALVLAALDEPCTDEEMAEYGCQCAADLAQPILARIEAIVLEIKP